MKAVLSIVVLAAIGVGGYFLADSQGWLGAAALSKEDAEKALQAHVDKVTGAEDGEMKWDDWSSIVGAKRDGLTVTMEGKTSLDAEKLADDYLESRKGQAGNLLCRDKAMLALLKAGGKIVQNWKSADGKEIGTVTVEGTFCDGYHK